MSGNDHLKIRYVKLHFKVEFTESTDLHPHKAVR